MQVLEVAATRVSPPIDRPNGYLMGVERLELVGLGRACSHRDDRGAEVADQHYG